MKLNRFWYALAIMVMVLMCGRYASAEYLNLDAPIVKVIVKETGAKVEYVQILISEQVTHNGISFQDTFSAMVWDDSGEVQNAKMLQPGTNLKAVAVEGVYRGRKQYTVRKLLTEQ